MIAVVLCAGFATRMYQLTKNFPKPLLDVAGKPVINYLMDQLVVLPGLDAIYLVSNGKFYSQFVEWKRHWGHGDRSRCPVVELLNDGAMNNDNRLGASYARALVRICTKCHRAWIEGDYCRRERVG